MSRTDHRRWKSVLCVVAAAVILLINFGPIYYLARIVHPCDDDFVTSISTRLEFMSSGSVLRTLNAALKYVYREYMGWQGTWSFNFFECLQPGVWGEQWYWVGPVLVVTFLLGGYLFLGHAIFKIIFKVENPIWILIILVPLCFWQQYLMYPEQAYFWWTGASYYVMYHGWAMIILAALIRTCASWDRFRTWQKILATILLSAAGCFVGGGNFTTALMMDVCLGLGAILSTILRRKTGTMQWIVTAASGVGLLISVLAPGNRAHMESDFEEKISPFVAIFNAIVAGLKDIAVRSHVEIILMLVATIPFLYLILKDIKFEFRLPGLFTFLSLGVYLSGYAPAAYAVRGLAPGRMINLYYLSYYMLLWANATYWTGWVARKGFLNKILSRKWFLGLVSTGVLVCILISGVVILKDRMEGLTIYKFRKEANNNLYQEYDAIMKGRVDYIETHPGEKASFRTLPVELRSGLFYWRDWGDNAYVEVRENMARYYGLSEIEFY